MSGTTDEHQNSRIKPENEQTPLAPLSPLEEGTPDQVSNNDNATLIEIKPVKKLILSVKTVMTLAVLAALIGGISIVTKQFKPSSSMAGMEDMKGMSMEDMMRVDGSSNPTPVKVESIKSGLMEASVRYTGTVRPYLEVTVYPRVGGQLTEYSAYPGSKVKAGQVLARLTATELSDEVEEATTEMEAAKAEERATREELDEQRQEIQRMAAESTYLDTRVQRTEQVLLNSGAIARNDFDKQKSEATAAKASLGGAKVKLERMQAQIAKAQAQVAQAKVKIQRLKVIESYKIITSPITGIVQERMADPGVVVQPGMGILKIGDYRKVRLQANVAQQNLAGVEIGSPVVARVIGNSTKTIKAKVTSIFPKAGEETRTVTVESVVDNPGGQILAGQAVQMQIITARKPNALSVPQAALVESEGKQAVWVLAGKSAKRKFITTGLTTGDRVEATSGLQPGDLVITSGQERLIENASVAAIDDSGQPVASLSSAVQGNTQIKLVSPQGKAVSGDNQLILEVQDSKTKKPVQVEGLEVSVTMPMKNSSPMSTDVEVKPDTQLGRFKVNTYLGMSGKWEVTAKVKDSSRIGSGSFTLDNRP
ncbi:efflux RND transporter periplasmic adaptor subunit (plasmid) [Brasilonema octagenarum UFV-E1]|uniref:Efflux RND transporter periplasmic adaptor subunit n=2 Tax=Brasilonema TaxID=383614 RepID=A0A856MMF0_9CYAN|nr:MULTISPECIES: efflux RND transporter periplasmic adaptor subunit [Brasilonema]NMF61678.1 efflux RND transporter periplasmic adaptor subunit [Brasilonema octagenarum UFV-OR1]QDL12613.1 efflux RND transporter periplasmic adaptor subunit [Brasilonema sennae CENA114]QDL19008.1 efflux RND transporter periplasmic adaptor subunit [Brasilonema octagenarum UFV-E1]